MNEAMTVERATEFGSAWNSGDADLVAGYFTEDGEYHASVGPEPLGKSFHGREDVKKGVQEFFDRFPNGRFENLKVVVTGSIGTFEWEFVATDPDGEVQRTSGCDLLEFDGMMVRKKNAFHKVRV
jgi:ketosteroid isomerase-like protein